MERALENYIEEVKSTVASYVYSEGEGASFEDSIFIVSEIQKMGLKFWDGFRIYIEQNNLIDFNWNIAFDISNKLRNSKNLVAREVSFGKSVLNYVADKPELFEEIKALSKLEDTESIEIKFIYDKLLLLSKEDWRRIIDVSTQTKIIVNIELANVKAVQSALFKKENVKEQALIKAYESIKKLKKFGINI